LPPYHTISSAARTKGPGREAGARDLEAEESGDIRGKHKELKVLGVAKFEAGLAESMVFAGSDAENLELFTGIHVIFRGSKGIGGPNRAGAIGEKGAPSFIAEGLAFLDDGEVSGIGLANFSESECH